MSASFEEKSVWIQLASLVAVLGLYFKKAFALMSDGVTEITAYAALFAVSVVMLVVVLVVGHILAAIVSRPEKEDERDRLIGWRAEANASYLLGAGVLSALIGLVLGIDDVQVAHVLLLSLFLSEVAALLLRILYYRRGI